MQAANTNKICIKRFFMEPKLTHMPHRAAGLANPAGQPVSGSSAWSEGAGAGRTVNGDGAAEPHRSLYRAQLC